jgi:hypothetical protein
LYGPQFSAILRYPQSETSFIAASANAGVYIGGPIFGLFSLIQIFCGFIPWPN